MIDYDILEHHSRVKDVLYQAINNDDVETIMQLFLTKSILNQCPLGYLNPAIKRGNLEVIALLLKTP